MATDAVYIARLASCEFNPYLVNPTEAYTSACVSVRRIVDQINLPYTGSTSYDRLAFLKRRKNYMTARAAVIQGALVELSGTDVSDKTAQTIKGFGGLAVQLGAAIPGIGTVATLIGTGAQLIAGLFDKTADNEARKATEIAELQNDLVGLKTLYDDTNTEIQSLMLPRYLLYGAAGLVILAVVVVLIRRRRS
ncbi:hypothetical protein ACAW74_18115 [Fibrella sp. WM1]|uniref:hypothetical protein n=1 Tax=Fibrella musci TaxID=3242485 RepID=UPI0035225A06